ncbi:Lipid A biosynthesis (KDO) 2-(lauroyl)-lipid IVA acyltransferase [Enterobacter hormaechei]|nr:Lipid A biosynthesis (KDO) 2-(lauroyl)-lipid IVA acyltransferase [Enterobacter hormaechei]
MRGRQPRYTIRIYFCVTRPWNPHGNQKNNIEYIPEFEKSFRHPRNWGAWIGVYAFAGMALLPASLRDPVLGKGGAPGRALG